MLRELKPSAIAIGFFFGLLVPFGIFYLAPLFLSLATGERLGDVPVALTLFWYLSAFLAPVLAGYLAARLAGSQPLMHGLVVGMLGATCAVLFNRSVEAAVITFIVFSAGGIVGGWLWKKLAARP